MKGRADLFVRAILCASIVLMATSITLVWLMQRHCGFPSDLVDDRTLLRRPATNERQQRQQRPRKEDLSLQRQLEQKKQLIADLRTIVQGLQKRVKEQESRIRLVSATSSPVQQHEIQRIAAATDKRGIRLASHAPGNLTREEKELTSAEYMRLISTRDAFPFLLNYFGWQGRGVGGEIGVYGMEFSDRLIRIWRPERFELMELRDRHEFKTRRDLLHYEGRAAKVNVTWHQGFSWDIAGNFSDSYFDFLYIDGSHHYDSVLKDLHDFWPKMRSGAILAGHDFCGDRMHQTIQVQPGVNATIPWCGVYDGRDQTRKTARRGGEKQGQQGSARAVLEFFAAKAIRVFHTREDRIESDMYNERLETPPPRSNPSWWVVVP
ncbi:unnamed protein product [Vitrella brassicaformis CCMP3155]|uniref:Methyltransferase domain-containing protein n=1 Tax=Vitrella brassicaformis (strain CCMP3155) TaxID=1169540 RepID=A0A0G4GV32_VITBC|nr:unnamed protein product [Vitrella brassicaformis CCMP3155]|eukprot:CEM34701.1 unnamed protein product [Vitrella brassicaformis CCMP3155]